MCVGREWEGRRVLARGDSAIPKSRWQPCPASWTYGKPPGKIDLIDSGSMNHVSAIRLIRTDTTLDLSQKAEKGMLDRGGQEGCVAGWGPTCMLQITGMPLVHVGGYVLF